MKIRQYLRSSFARALVFLLMTAQLVACIGGGGGNDAASVSGVSTLQKASSSSVSSSFSSTPHVLSGSAIGSQAVARSVTISWTAPVARADGSPLSLADIEGFRIYYGTSEGDYPNFIDVVDSSAVQLTLNGLPRGTYYLVMTTYDVAGSESVFSPVLVKTI